jgi:hypothetical protein
MRTLISFFLAIILIPAMVVSAAPKEYLCYRSAEALTIDGNLDESSWRKAPATDVFVDIEGDARPGPRFTTRARMLWDDQ